MTDPTGSRVIVDLSVPIAGGMPVYPGDPQVHIQAALGIAAGDAVNVRAIHLGSHTGTHIDAPSHVRDGWPDLDAVPLDRYTGPLRVADVSDLDPRAGIVPERLRSALAGTSPGTILLLRTGWSSTWGTARYLEHPWLRADAAEAILDAGVRTVGIDALSIDETLEDLATARLEAHEIILGAGGVVIENLAHLERLEGLESAWLYCLPLPLVDSDGSPARAVAVGRRLRA